jgi:hypothetical protein
MTKDEVNALAKEFLEVAVGFIKKGQDVQPVLLCVKEGTINAVPLQMRDERDKALLEKFIPELVTRFEPEASFLVTDGWMKDPTGIQRIGEVIMIAALSEHGTTGAAVKYTRTNDGPPSFGEIEVFDHLETRFFKGLLPEQTVH